MSRTLWLSDGPAVVRTARPPPEVGELKAEPGSHRGASFASRLGALT